MVSVSKRLKILFIPYGGRISPATRYRICQIVPFLRKKGVSCEVYSILSDTLTAKMIRSSAFSPFQKFIYYFHVTIEKFIRTWKIISMADNFDIIFLQRTTFPFGLERLLEMRNNNIIFDIDDPIYLTDKEERGLMGRIKKYIKRKEVISMLKVAKCAIVENNYIKSFVQRYCDDIYLIVGPIDTIKNFPKSHKINTGELTIGWIGTPSTTPYLKILDNVLKNLSKKYNIKVRLIGAGSYALDGVEVELVAWNEDTEVLELHKIDIGIMPMPDNEWTRGKVGCKMLQYMANAIPTVVSRTPTTLEIIKDGDNGFLAGSEQEWFYKLSALIENQDLREAMEKNGRKTVEEICSIEDSIPRYLDIITKCLDKRCYFCGSTKNVNSYIPSTLFNGKIFKYYRCKDCGLNYIYPLPDNTDYEKLYTNEYHRNLSPQKDFNKQFLFIKSFLPGAKILDFGCGRGDFIAESLKRGYNCSGVEYNKSAAVNLMTKFKDVKFYTVDDFFYNVKEKYDVIRVSNVLEHLMDARETFQNFKKYLNKSGFILVEGPLEDNINVALMLKKLYFKLKKFFSPHILATHPPCHIIFSNYKNQLDFFEKTGFKKITYRIEEHCWPFPSSIGEVKSVKEALMFFIGWCSVLLSRFIPVWGNYFIYVGKYE